MLRLSKIMKTDDYISADYTPEGSLETGFLKIRLSTKEIVEKKATKAFGLQIAKKQLLRLSELKITPEEKDCLWF